MGKIRSLIKKARSLYERSSLQFVMSLSFIVVTLLGTFILGLLFMRRFMTTTQDIVIEKNQTVVNQVGLNLDNYLHNMMNLSNGTYHNVLKGLNLEEEGADIDQDMRLLYDTNADYLVSITVFNELGKVVSSVPMSQIKENVNVQDTDWFREADEKIENLHFSTPHVQNIFSDNDGVYRWVISLSRSVELNYGGMIQRGVLLVDMNVSGIEQICKNAEIGDSGYLYLINSEGEIIYHPKQQLIYTGLETENAAVSDYADGTYTEDFQGQERYVTVKTVGYTGWKIIGVSYASDTSSYYNGLLVFTWFIVAFTAAIMVVVDSVLSRQITDPIKQLESELIRMGEGYYDEEIAVSGPYEIQHLAEKMNSMSKQIKKLMDDIVKEQTGKRKSEMDALQAQINPHFLYNTLDSIIWMIENERYEGAIEMVTALARLFRISLNKGKNTITISQELEHVRNYLVIQQIRYKNKFSYEITMEQQLGDCLIINLVTQPLVENALYHCVEYMVDEGEISINAYEKEGDIYVDVIDNGPGMPPEQVERLLTTPHAGGKGSGVGVKNVHERLQLYFGADYGLNIISELDEGTTVRIHIPKVFPHEEGGKAK